MGAPHNLVRHPHMPPAAFANLWATIQAGRPWDGLVKNSRQVRRFLLGARQCHAGGGGGDGRRGRKGERLHLGPLQADPGAGGGGRAELCRNARGAGRQSRVARRRGGAHRLARRPGRCRAVGAGAAGGDDGGGGAAQSGGRLARLVRDGGVERRVARRLRKRPAGGQCAARHRRPDPRQPEPDRATGGGAGARRAGRGGAGGARAAGARQPGADRHAAGRLHRDGPHGDNSHGDGADAGAPRIGRNVSERYGALVRDGIEPALALARRGETAQLDNLLQTRARRCSRRRSTPAGTWWIGRSRWGATATPGRSPICAGD